TEEEERRRIAEDIHDDTMQRLFGIPMWLDLIARDHPELHDEERFTRLRADVGDSIARLRHLAFELHPPVLDTEGLVAAIEALLEGWKTLGVFPDYAITDRLTKEPPKESRSVVY